MFGLAAVLFFSVTGITLNHPDWFFAGAGRSAQSEGQINLKWLHFGARSASPHDDQADQSDQIARLEVVEHLRNAHGVRGALTELRADDRECMVTFKGPGYSADAFIDRESGQYTLTQSYQGLVAVINDLHKGRDTGKVWSGLIDVSAVLMTIISLTGLLMLFYLKRRRLLGLGVALAGTAAVVATVFWFVP